MGSEQSSHTNISSNESKSKNTKLKRGKSVPESSWHRNSQDEHLTKAVSTNTSPGHSVCSDKDLAFVSYTINQPIGDSPKKPSTFTRGRSMQIETKKTTKKLTKVTPKHNIVVVRSAIQEDQDIDENLIKLKHVPVFLPIIRGTISLPAARDHETLERIDSNSFYRLCFQYQTYLNSLAKTVSSDQTLINKQISELENNTAKILSQHLANYKHYAKICEQFKYINDMNKQLNSCHMLLNQTLDSVQLLNNNLPVEDRLEPFVWTTG